MSVSTPPSPAPGGKQLTQLAASAFNTAKLTGMPEVSPVRATHDNQLGEWFFCIKSNSADQPLKYGVLITNNAVLDVRSSVLIDGCDQETYQPLPATNPTIKSDAKLAKKHVKAGVKDK